MPIYALFYQNQQSKINYNKEEVKAMQLICRRIATRIKNPRGTYNKKGDQRGHFHNVQLVKEMKRLTLAFELVKNMGFRYVLYRVWFFIEKKAGVLKYIHPTQPKSLFFISLDQWRKHSSVFLYKNRSALHFTKIKSPILKEKAARILNGEIQFFSNEWISLGKEYNWITNPDTHYEYHNTQHWSEINDFNTAQGDIKYVWEKSRFSYLITVMRYDYHFDEDHSEFVFKEIGDWMEWNPINQGPNWKCSQEISLRLFNWMYLLNFYKDSIYLTPELWDKIQNVLYWQLHHIYHHIDFSRIAVRNNHAMTETLALSLSELFFPFIPETKKWSQRGRKYFEQEIEYQIDTDGAFIQHSMNYHRVLIQLLSFGLSITEKAQQAFSIKVYEKAYSSLNFLLQFVQKENGELPNYGANDGAWFFPLSDSAYRDYRPQLNTLHCILTGTSLFGQREDFWEKNKNRYPFRPLKIQMGIVSFKQSGYYLFRKEQSFTFIKCGSYRDRPSHADNLHLDVWVKGINVLRDSGSYKYNTDERSFNYFFGTLSHNTVIVEGYSQMLKGSRFIWYYWSKALSVKINETEDKFIFEGTIKAFQELGGIHHKRKLIIYKHKNVWEVKDVIIVPKQHKTYQLWHCIPDSECCDLQIDSDNAIGKEYLQSYYSSFYGSKELQKGIAFEFKNKIKTTIQVQ
jgi:hypothetical protein